MTVQIIVTDRAGTKTDLGYQTMQVWTSVLGAMAQKETFAISLSQGTSDFEWHHHVWAPGDIVHAEMLER